MGVDFRGKGYVRYVRLGKRRVKDGEACAVWNQYGQHTEVVGPKLVRLYWSTIRFLERHVAESHQYLRVKFRDGTTHHIKGPSALFENPVYHLDVTVETSLLLSDSSSYLVVQSTNFDSLNRGEDIGAGTKNNSDAPVTKQKTVVGPKVFFPEPTDTVHTFNWTDSGAGTLSHDLRVLNMRVPIVRLLQCNVKDASEYGAKISVELRARLTSIDGALSVKDPIAECDTLVQTAVLKVLTGVQFAQKDNSLATIVRVAINETGFEEELRKALQQYASCELLSFRVVDAKASQELERLYRKEDELAAAKVKEQLAVIQLDAAMDRQEREQKLQAAKQEHELNLENERANAARKRDELSDQQKLKFLGELKKMNVDLTRYLCTKNFGTDAAEANGFVEAEKRWWQW